MKRYKITRLQNINLSIFEFANLMIWMYICAALILFPYTVCSQTSEEYFKKAEQEYQSGKTELAIKDLEKVLEIDPHHFDAKILLGMYLNELAMKYYSQKEYQKAFPYLEKLQKLLPDDKEINQMYETAKKHLESVAKNHLQPRRFPLVDLPQ